MKKQRGGRRRKGKGERSRKLYFLIGALAIVIVGSLAGWLFLAKEEISFKEAMKKPELRSGYIEQIIERVGKPDYITVVDYVDTPEELEFLRKEYGYIPAPDVLMALYTPEIPVNLLGKQTFPVRIFVFPFAFTGEIIKIEDDFISSLLHEYFHADIIQEGKIGSFEIVSSFLTIDGQWNKDLFLDVKEMVVIRRELASQTKISKRYRVNRLGRYLNHYTNIWGHSEGMEPKFIEGLKIEFFESWMLDTPFLFKELEKEKEIWYFKHPKTGQRYYLPEEVIRKFQNGKE